MARLRLVHWNKAEGNERARTLRAAGHTVAFQEFGPELMKKIRARPPEAMVIDLERLPMQGRDVALMVRSAKSTRALPLVFAGGEKDKVAKIQKQVPDAQFATWRGVRGAIQRALASPPTNPKKPSSILAGYSGTPLPKKLGIKPGSIVALVGAPDGLAATIGELPEGATLRNGLRGKRDLILWFPKNKRDLETRTAKMAKEVGRDGMWIAWPKKASGVKTDLTENLVRSTGLNHGLVDYKIAAIDATWSGLKFVYRVADR